MHTTINKYWPFIALLALLLFAISCGQSTSMPYVKTTDPKKPTELPKPSWTKTPIKNITPLITETPYKTRTPLATKTPWPKPWGLPAQVVASMPESIPCSTWSKTGCRWDFKVTFSVKGEISATVERIRRVFVDRQGRRWTSLGGIGWGDVNIKISPGQTGKYTSWVRTTTNPDLKGGRVDITYEGHDANGNPFTGQVSTKLSSP